MDDIENPPFRGWVFFSSLDCDMKQTGDDIQMILIQKRVRKSPCGRDGTGNRFLQFYAEKPYQKFVFYYGKNFKFIRRLSDELKVNSICDFL